MQERLGLAMERYDAGETTSELNVILQRATQHAVRRSTSLPLAGDEAAANIAARLTAMPHAVEQFKQTLREAADAGHVYVPPPDA